jgi:hypothetical protein
MKAIDLGLIQARRAKLDEQINAQREILATLEAKRSELEIAERVFAELALETTDNDSTQATPRRSEQDGTRLWNRYQESIKELAKPAGLPTVPEMIIEALRHAHGLGAPGLEPAGIVSFIRGRYWPNAPSQSITPTVWRMWSKDKKLEKHDALYALPEAERPKPAVQSSSLTDALLFSTSPLALREGYTQVSSKEESPAK